MTLTMTSKKSALVVCLVAPLALAACGSDEDSVDAVSQLATETNKVTVAPDGSVVGEDQEGEKPADPNSPENPVSPGAGGVVNPFEDANLPQVEIKPIEGGQPASQADIEALTATMNRIYNPQDMASWTSTILDNSCQKVVDQMHGELASRGTSVEQHERETRQAMNAAEAAGTPFPPIPATQASVADARVDGDIASATVTVTTKGQSNSAVQRFAREGGQWKVCN